MKVLLALSAFTAASADVALRWPDSAATTLAALLFGPLIFAIVWLTVRGSQAKDERHGGEAVHDHASASFESEEAVEF
jgi:hypothetical protein